MNETNRVIVVECLENLFVRKDFDAAKAALREDFVTHSPGNPSGREAFTEAMRAAAEAGAAIDVKRVLADGDLVAVHLHLRQPGDEQGRAVVDILRVEDGLIAEHWDVQQPAETGMF